MSVGIDYVAPFATAWGQDQLYWSMGIVKVRVRAKQVIIIGKVNVEVVEYF